MSNKRVYSDKEIGAVLKRAAELQRTEGSGRGNAAGLSLEELEQIAAESGIDPSFVQRAALELEEERPDETFHLLGAPTAIDLERVIEGEMTEARWEEAVSEFRRVYGTSGEAGQVGRTREWVHRDEEGERVHISVSPAGTKTRIRINYQMVDWAWALHITLPALSIPPIVLQFVFLNLGPLVEMGVAIFILAAFHMIARLSFGAVARKQDKTARKLLARLSKLLATPEAALPERIEEPTASETGRIDASLLSDSAEAEHAVAGRREEREQKQSG